MESAIGEGSGSAGSPVNYDHLYIGGGNAKKIRLDLPGNVTLVSNVARRLGGIALWEGLIHPEQPPQLSTESADMHLHHVSIRTADIFASIAFYERLGFEMETRFTAGITLACWLRGPLGRLELIQIPEPEPAPDAFGDPHYVGYYHLSILVESLEQTLADLKDAKVLLPPQLQAIGAENYQVAFIADPDGLPIEFMEKQN